MHSDGEVLKYRPKTSQSKQKVQNQYISNYQSALLQRRLRSVGQSRHSDTSSSQKKRILQKYFNGGSDTLSVEMRQTYGMNKSLVDHKHKSQHHMTPQEDTHMMSKIKNIPSKQQQHLPPAAQNSSMNVGYPSALSFFNNKDFDQCFEFDASFLDNLSLNNEQIQKMLVDLGVEKGPAGIDVEKIVLQNQDYLHHILNNCACFKCQCGKCRCNYAAVKLTYKNGFNTIYGKQFTKYDPQKFTQAQTLNQSHYETLSKISIPSQVNSMITTNQLDFQVYPLQKKPKRSIQIQMTAPFIANTTYQKNFPDWQDYDPSWKFSRPQHNSVCRGSSLHHNQSSYSKDFGNNSISSKIDPNLSADDIKKNQIHKTFMNEYPTQNLTQYNQTFQKLVTSDVEHNRLPYKYQTQTQNYNPVSSFEGQYLSTTKQSYLKINPVQCPAQKMIAIKKVNSKQIQQYLVDKIKELATKSKANPAQKFGS